MNAYIIEPTSGETKVKPHTKITIIFEKGEVEDVNIRIDGEEAVRDGKTRPGYCTLEDRKIGDKIKWSIRKVGGLENRDILVQASSAPDCYTIEERFFVDEASTVEDFEVENQNWCHTRSKIFGCEGTPLQDGIELESLGVPDEFIEMSDEMDAGFSGDEWRFVGCNDNRTVVVGPEFDHMYPFGSYAPSVQKDMINVRTGDCETSHLPFQYTPSLRETEMYTFEHSLENVDFWDGLHVWWQEDKFITKRDPEPVLGCAENMLWTAEDIGEEIKKLEIMSKDVLFINDHIIVETGFPKVRYL